MAKIEANGSIDRPFTQEQAKFRYPHDDEFRPGHKRCKDCAHYDDNGHCRIVPSIVSDGYCEEFFADIGVFAHKHPEGVEINLVMYGEKFDWEMDEVDNFDLEIVERLQQKVREMDEQI